MTRRGNDSILGAVTSLPSSVEELIAFSGPVNYLMFWGHQPQRDGSIGPGCLSQWWPAEFAVDGVHFRSAEHYMMWRKATLFGDSDTAGRIVAAGHPCDAKMLGRRVAGFDEQTWAD